MLPGTIHKVIPIVENTGELANIVWRIWEWQLSKVRSFNDRKDKQSDYTKSIIKQTDIYYYRCKETEVEIIAHPCHKNWRVSFIINCLFYSIFQQKIQSLINRDIKVDAGPASPHQIMAVSKMVPKWWHRSHEQVSASSQQLNKQCRTFYYIIRCHGYMVTALYF